ncbi:MAG: hypothetical protein LUC37_02120 [Prevotella sp.]|nr:hypothetical protein [Prevotella sp.]
MATISRVGFGQVEPNHLSAQRTGQIYAQLPANDEIEILENGQFVKYDYTNKEVNFTGSGEWMLVYNEEKLYDDFWREHRKDFAMIKSNYTPGSDITHEGWGPFEGQMVPRVFKTNIGDIYTTNCVGGGNTDGNAEYEGIDLEEGDTVSPNSEGYLESGSGDITFEVVKVYTMPDGQPAVKLMRIA